MVTMKEAEFARTVRWVICQFVMTKSSKGYFCSKIQWENQLSNVANSFFNKEVDTEMLSVCKMNYWIFSA